MNSLRLEWSSTLASIKSETPRRRWAASWTRFQSGSRTATARINFWIIRSHVLKASNRSISTIKRKIHRCSSISTWSSRIIKSFPSMSLIMWLIPIRSNSLRHPFAIIALKYLRNQPKCTVWLRMRIFAWSVIRIITALSCRRSIIGSISMKNLRSLGIAISIKLFNWSSIAVFAVKLYAWTVRSSATTWVEKWESTL